MALDWRGLLLSLWDSVQTGSWEENGNRWREDRRGRNVEADRFQTLLSVLDYSLPPLLFQSVSSSFLSLIFALPSSASFPVEADLTRIPEIQCVFAFTPKVTNYDH